MCRTFCPQRKAKNREWSSCGKRKFWKDGFRRLRKNKLAMASLFVIIVIMISAFIIPAFYPYSYEQQIRGSENLGIMEYSESELERIEAGERCFRICLEPTALAGT